MSPGTAAHRWTRRDLEADTQWIRILDRPAIDDWQRALDHALSCGRPLLQLDRSDFPLGEAGREALRWVVQQTQERYGAALLRGLPVDGLDDLSARVLFWGIGLHLGVARPQGRLSQFMSDVRAEGGVYRSPTGRGYNTNAGLDFHSDAADVVALLCLRAAPQGGESLMSSALAARDALKSERPDLVELLHQPFVYSRQGEQAPEEAPYFAMPIFAAHEGRLACRYVRNHIAGAQATFADVPRLTAAQVEALDRFDATLARDDLCLRMYLRPGDVQFLNNHVVLHSRSPFADHPEPERRRHLLRLWLAIPEAQALPESFAVFFKDAAARAVRGGHRGQAISDEIRAYEQRLADQHGMALRIYADRDAALPR